MKHLLLASISCAFLALAAGQIGVYQVGANKQGDAAATQCPADDNQAYIAGGTLAYQGTDGFGAWQDLWAIEYSDTGLPGVAWIEMYLTVPSGMSASLKFTDMRMPTQTLTVYDADQETIIMEANCIKDYATLDEAAADGNTTDAAVAYASKYFSSGELILGAGYHQFYIRMVARVADVAEVGLSARVDLIGSPPPSPSPPAQTAPPGAVYTPSPPPTESMEPPVPVSGLPYTISVIATQPSAKQVVVPYCLVDGPNTYMYCPDGGNGTTLPEQFTIFTPSMDNAQVINDGESFIIRSKLTNRFCRLDSPDDTLTNIRCDQTSYLAATSFTFSETKGMTYLDQPILKGTGSTPLYLGASNTAGAKLHFAVAPIVNGSYITIATADGTCVVDNSTSTLACTPGGTGNSQSEKYVAVGNASLIRYGMPVYLASVQTGLFCRKVNASMVCDVTGTATATALTYMGSSFMVGDEFVITSAPLIISPTPTTIMGETGFVSGMAYHLMGPGFCKVDSDSSYLYCSADTGTVLKSTRKDTSRIASKSAKSPPPARSPPPRKVTAKQSNTPSSSLTGSTLAEQFRIFSPDLSLGTAIMAGSPVILYSRQTGKYCRMEAPTAAKVYIRCDQSSHLAAAVLVYTGTGFTHQDVDLVFPGVGKPICLAPTGSDPAQFPFWLVSTARVNLTANAVYALSSFNPGFCRINSVSSYMTCPPNKTMAAAERFAIMAYNSNATTVHTGQQFTLMSLLTKQYCTVMPIPYTEIPINASSAKGRSLLQARVTAKSPPPKPAGKAPPPKTSGVTTSTITPSTSEPLPMGIICNVPAVAATPLVYTGYGFEFNTQSFADSYPVPLVVGNRPRIFDFDLIPGAIPVPCAPPAKARSPPPGAAAAPPSPPPPCTSPPAGVKGKRSPPAVAAPTVKATPSPSPAPVVKAKASPPVKQPTVAAKVPEAPISTAGYPASCKAVLKASAQCGGLSCSNDLPAVTGKACINGNYVGYCCQQGTACTKVNDWYWQCRYPGKN